MDLIRLMNANRKADGLASGSTLENTKRIAKAEKAVAVDVNNKPKTLYSRRQEIIKDKPKVKAVREYFKAVVDKLGSMSDDDEEI